MFADVIKSHLDEMQSNLFTNIPAVVVAVGEKSGSTVVNVKVAVRYTANAGITFEEDVLSDIPVMFPSANDCFLTLPVEIGDEVMLEFSMRDSSRWLRSSNQVEDAFSLRQHDISDAYAYPAMLKFGNAPKAKKGTVELCAKDASITLSKDGSIRIGGSAAKQAMVLGDELKTLLTDLINAYNSHGHGGNGANPPATFTGDLEAILSKDVKTK